jgi:MFS family permease
LYVWDTPAVTLTYSEVLRTKPVGRVAFSMLLSRTSSEAMAVVLVLFVLAEFGSPALAGLTVFMDLAPGLLVAPVMGAFLDRRGRSSLIVFDFCAAATMATLLAALSWHHWLSPGLMLLIVGCSSLTNPLSFSGLRSSLPLLLPRTHWDRANGIDGVTADVATMFGPALAGLLVGFTNARIALLVLAGIWLAAASAVFGVRIPSLAKSGRSVWHDARSGLNYVLQNPTLRGIGVSVSVLNLGSGAVVVCLPLVVFQRLHGGAQMVGLLWTCAGIASAVASVAIGRMSTAGREFRLYASGMVVCAVGIFLLALSQTLWLALVAVVFVGGSNGLISLPAWAMRQRRTDPAMFGRVLAISMSLNMSGVPIGSALAGPLARTSPQLALMFGAACAFVGVVLTWLLIPARHPTDAT